MASGGARGANSLHTSSLLCKLLSPLLTTHGMDKRTGKAVPLAQLLGRDEFDCGSLAERAFLVQPELLNCPGYGIDRTGSTEYLCETLDKVQRANGGDSRLVPLHVDGDGHCLVHAVSRALVGRELFWHALRTALHAHLAQEKDTYRTLLSDFLLDDEWDEIVSESKPGYRPPRGTLHGLRNVHLLGLANVLRRPIILLDSHSGMASSGDYAGTFLPGLVPSDQRRQPHNGKLHRPLCVAWANPQHMHFVPLVGVRGLVPPVLPRTLLPKVWGFTEKDLEDYIDFSDGDCCVIGGDRMLTDSYVERLISSMQEMFTEKHGIPPSFVVDCQEFLNIGSWKMDEEIIGSLKQCLSEGRLYRCIDCTGVFVIGHKLIESNCATTRDVPGDEQQIVVNDPSERRRAGDKPLAAQAAVSDASLPLRCNSCSSEKVRKIREDGSTQYENIDQTTTRSSRCKCGFKHYWDGEEYDGLPQLLTLSFSLHGKRVEDTLVVFRDQSDPRLNTDVQKVARYLQLRHFAGTEISVELERMATVILKRHRLTLPSELNEQRSDAAGEKARTADAVGAEKRPEDGDTGAFAAPSTEMPASREQARCRERTGNSSGVGTVLNAQTAVAAAAAAAGACEEQGLARSQDAVPDPRSASPNAEPTRGRSHCEDAPSARPSDIDNTNKELVLLNTMAIVLGDNLWSFVKRLPYTFCKAGVFCRKASEDLELVDGLHCSFPCLPAKVFVYNEYHRRLDICLLERGHCAVGPELDDREAAWPPEARGGSLPAAGPRVARGAMTLAPRSVDAAL